MDNKSFRASGRISIDDFQERFFLFLSASTHVTLDGQVVPASSLPATDPEFAARLLEGLSLAGREIPEGSSSNPSALSRFRIIRLLDESFDVVPQDLQTTLIGPGDPSRAVTIAGHVATAQEMGSHDQVTDPTVTLDRVVPFEAIQRRAFEISQSEEAESAVDNWLRAERELAFM